jgi:hypothetical protein
MKRHIMILVSLVLFAGCVIGQGRKEISFEWFNLSVFRIKVVDVGGMPPNVMPGVLSPSPNEILPTKTSIAYGPVHIKNLVKIIWQEDGVSHETEMKRDDLKIPAILTDGTVRFTYLGDDKWRVSLITTSQSK